MIIYLKIFGIIKLVKNMRDKSIYDKYLNMKPKEKKKLDLTVKFDSKIQKIGVIIFGIGLLFIIFGFCFMFFKKYDDKVVPEGTEIIENVNIRDFGAISTADGVVSIDATQIVYKKDLDVSEMNLNINVKEDMAELPIKITFNLENQDPVVITDYLVDVHAGDPISIFKQNEEDLTQSTSWKVEITTKEDLEKNYDYTF